MRLDDKLTLAIQVQGVSQINFTNHADLLIVIPQLAAGTTFDS